MGNPFSKTKHHPKKDIYKPAKTLPPIILPTPTKKSSPKTATSTNVCRHLKKIIKCFTFLTQHDNDNIDKPRPHKKIRKRIKKVHKYNPSKLPNNNVTRTGSEITAMPPPPAPFLPPEFQLHWIRSKKSLLSYALSKLAFFSKDSKEILSPAPDHSTDNPALSKQIKFRYKNKTSPSVNATSSTTEKEAIIPTSTQGHQISLYDLKIDQKHQISLSDIEINQEQRQIRLSDLKIDQGDQISFENLKKDQGHQISLYDLNNNLTLKHELLAKILSSPTIGATNDKYNFLRRKRSLSPEEIFRRNLRRFETLLAITESLSSISSCASVTSMSAVDMESVKLSEKIIQTEVDENNNSQVEEEQEGMVTVMQGEYTGEFDENGNPIIKTSQESSLGKKSSDKISMTAATTASIGSRSSFKQGNSTNLSSGASYSPRRIITRSKSPVEVDTYFMNWVKARLFKSPDESGEAPSTVVGQVETTVTSHSSPSSSCSSSTKKSDKDDAGEGHDKDDNNNDMNKDDNDKSEKKKGPFEYLRKGGGRRASTAGRDWSESRSKSRSPGGTERKNKKGKGKGSGKTGKSGTATTTTTETSESTAKTEEEGTSEQPTGKKKETQATKTEGPPIRPCEKCGPCAGKGALSGAPPAYLDYGEGEYANITGQAWKGKRKGDPVMDRLKNVDVVEEMTYLVPSPPDCGGGGDAGREEEEIDDDCDYYAVCESCGEMEPIPEELKKELQAKRRRKKRKGKSESLPVTYSRRQRFNFKNKGDMCDDEDGPPYPYEGQQCPGCRCTCCVAGLRRDQNCGCKCCETMGPLRKCNSFDEIPVGKNPQIRRILPQEEECARRLEICMQQMPDNSGTYRFDKENKMFERQVPRTPTPIILEVEVPEPLTKEQLVAIGRGIQEKKRLGIPVGTQAHCPPIEQDPVYLPPVYGQCNPPQCPPPCCVPNYCCPTNPGEGGDGKGKHKDKKSRRTESGTGSGSGSYPTGSSYSYATGYTNDDATTTGMTTSERTFRTKRTTGISGVTGTTGTRNTKSKKSKYSTLYSQNTQNTDTLNPESESSESLPSL